MAADVEVAVANLARNLAHAQDVAQLMATTVLAQLAAVESAYLAVLLVRAEACVDGAEMFEGSLNSYLCRRVEVGAVIFRITNVDDDRGAHDVLDPAEPLARPGGRHRIWASADWSDW